MKKYSSEKINESKPAVNYPNYLIDIMFMKDFAEYMLRQMGRDIPLTADELILLLKVRYDINKDRIEYIMGG